MGLDREKQMDHNNAIRTMAVERYTLHDMESTEQDAFEAHYFECNECWSAVSQASAFAGTVKLLGELDAIQEAPAPVSFLSRHRNWVMPLAASLVLVVGLELMRQRQQPAPQATYAFVSVPLGAARNAADRPAVPANTFGNDVRIAITELSASAVAYRAELFAAAGRSIQTWMIAPEEVSEEVRLPLRPLPPGGYELVIESVDRGGKRSEIARESFNATTEVR